jgi:O-antigen/teichoic acid export membrane protein
VSSLTKEKMFSGALWAGAGRLVSIAGNIVATMVLARAVSASDYAIYFVGLTTIVIVGCVGALGMDLLVVRFVALPISQGDLAGIRQVVARCLGIVTAAALLVAGGFELLGPHFFASILRMPGLVPYTGMLAASIFFATLQRQLAETFRALNDIRMATLSGGMRNGGALNAVIACFAMLALWVGGDLTLFTALLTMLGASVVIVAWAVAVLWRRLRIRGSREQTIRTPILGVAAAIREGWPLGLSGFIVALNSLGSVWLASPLDTASHVALFAMAQRVVLFLVAPMIVINAILPPIVAELHATSQTQRMERVVKSIGGLVLVPSLILLAVLVFAGRPILHLMFGAYYEAAYPSMILLCFGQIINIATGAWQIVLPMTGNRHELLTSSVIAVVTQLVVGLALGYFLGVFGVAAGCCVSILITNLVGMWMVRRKLGIWTYASLNWYTVGQSVGMIRARLTQKLAWQRSS